MRTRWWFVGSCAVAVFLLGTPIAKADDPGWPRELDLPEGRIVIFQPQLEEFEGNRIAGRTALSVTPAGASAPIFGVVWLEGLVEVDRDARTAMVYDIAVDRVQFPDESADIVSLIEREVPTWELELSLDRLLTSLESVEGARELAAELETAPPTIVVRTEPSVLVVIDGDPITEELEGTPLTRVVNTPFLMVRDGESRAYFLYAGTDAWYTARSVTGDWSYTTQVLASVADMAPDASDIELPDPGRGRERGCDTGDRRGHGADRADLHRRRTELYAGGRREAHVCVEYGQHLDHGDRDAAALHRVVRTVVCG